MRTPLKGGLSIRPICWHEQTPQFIADSLGVNPDSGLSAHEAARRLLLEGPNEITDRSQPGPLSVLWGQFNSLMVAILAAAAGISAALGDRVDAVAILAIVLLNAALGFRQEYRAEKAVAGLRKLSQPSARVLREGRIEEIPSRDLVPGDVVLVEAGNLISADARLLEAVQLRNQEAALSGESEPVHKDATLILPADAPLGDRRNMIYSGTLVTHGRGRALIVATAAGTELGRIAALIHTTDRGQTPLQAKLDELSRRLAVVSLAAVALIVLLGMWRGSGFKSTFLTGVSLMVAAVPEGLPAVVTIALALGAYRMLQRKALVRRLSAVETLGGVTVICTDKTGTLTENRMQVTDAVVGGREFPLLGTADATDCDLRLLLACGALANDALLNPEGGQPATSLGDPLEIALAQAARSVGIEKSELDGLCPRIAELAFSSARRRMTTVHRIHSPLSDSLRDVLGRLSGTPSVPSYASVTKGAVAELVACCDRVWMGGRAASLATHHREEIFSAVDRLANGGGRVLGIAFRQVPAVPPESELETLETGLIFLGIVSLSDPARAEVPHAMATCRAAGIRPIMITGDYPLTSRYVAEQVGLAEHAKIVTGEQLAALEGQTAWDETVRVASVFARVTPEQKLGIVQALRRQGHIVAMTGDGVNDAPALKCADIGISMGRSGTDVAREASTIVLQDDNFATIVAAVEEGRVIYDNLRKFARFMLASNSGELWVMLLGPMLGTPLPLLPLQILWMNLVTDGLPALALAMEPAEEDTMRRPPRRPGEGFFGRGMGWWILNVGGLLGLVSLACGYIFWRSGHEAWQTMLFTVLTLSQIALSLAVRSERASFFRLGLFSNRASLGAAVLTLSLQLLLVYLPAAQVLFHTRALSATELALCVALSSVVFWVVEAAKWMARIRNSDPSDANDRAR